MLENISAVKLRPATIEDVETIFDLIQALAEYEKLSHQVVGTTEQLKEHLFGQRPYAEVILAESNSKVVGFVLFFHNYSTFLTQPGIYLEDLFVLAEYRRKGIGKALIAAVAKLAIARNCGRLEWSVLDWNQPSIDFYRRMGADILTQWLTCRVTDTALIQLSQEDSVIQ
ncbi:MAG: GNAT family N-acetyltransferase [Microcoleaceae cyanobacterium]